MGFVYLIVHFKYLYKFQSAGVGLSTNQIYRQDGYRRDGHEFEDRSFHFKINEPIYYHLITLFKIKFNWFRVQQYFYLLKLAYFKNEISKAFKSGRFENLIIISYQSYWHFVRFFYVIVIVMIFTSFNGEPPFHFNIQKVCSIYSILISYFCCYQRLLTFVD